MLTLLSQARVCDRERLFDVGVLVNGLHGAACRRVVTVVSAKSGASPAVATRIAVANMSMIRFAFVMVLPF